MTTTIPDALRRHLNADGLLVREANVRAEKDTMTFTGIGVPYNEVIEHFFGREQFAPGSVESDGALVLYQHRDPVGRVTGGTDTEAGHRIDGQLSETSLGRDVHTLMRDGVITKLSIGFEPLEYTVSEDDDGELVTFTKVRAREFSLVPFPAYDSAALETVRHRTTPDKETPAMPETLTRADLTDALKPYEESLQDTERQLQALVARTAGAAAPAGSQFRSMGDFLKAIVAGDVDAAEFHRAYTGATTADTVMKDSFVGDFTRLVNERRRIVNKFSKGTLPADGMSVDYYQLDTDSTKVAKQAAEGADLPYGKVTLKSANAPVETYGGWTELSRQAIERATVPALNVTLEAMGIQYARTTNAAVAGVFSTIVAEKLAAATDAENPDTSAALSLAAGASTDEWLDMVVDASLAYEERGFTLSGLMVTAEVFKRLIRLKDGDRRLMTVQGQGINQVGDLNLKQVDGSLANVEVSLIPGVTGSVTAFYDPLAIKTLESAGAPAQLQDENIINLTKQFSIYGYQAVLVPFRDAILPINLG